MPGTTLPAADFAAAWAFLALNVLTPGPNVLNTIALAIGSGRRAALGAALGTGVAVTLWCLGMIVGVSALLIAVPLARAAMTVLAVALLVWFARRYLRAALAGFAARRRGDPPALAGRDGATLRSGMLRSLTIMLMNPKALTTWLTMTAVFPVARASGGDVVAFTLGACVIAAGIHSGYALAFSTATAARAFLRAAPVINLCVGVFFAGFAATLAWGLVAPD